MVDVVGDDKVAVVIVDKAVIIDESVITCIDEVVIDEIIDDNVVDDDGIKQFLSDERTIL